VITCQHGVTFDAASLAVGAGFGSWLAAHGHDVRGYGDDWVSTAKRDYRRHADGSWRIEKR